MADWVGYDTSQVLVSPTVDTAIYAANDCIGTLQPIAAGVNVNRRFGTGRMVKAVLYDKSSQISTHAVEAHFFRGNPTASTFTDQGAFAIHDDDLTKVAFSIQFSSGGGAQLFSSANNAWAVKELRCPYELLLDNMYVVFKAIGTPTFVAATDLALECVFERD